MEHITSHKSAAKIAGVYGILGVIWILISDRIAFRVATSEAALTSIQTYKGWAFVGASFLLIYGLVLRSQSNIFEKNERLSDVLHQATILHRILRHNLRNSCSVIGGNIDRLSEQRGDEEEIFEILRKRNDRLIRLSEKSRYLRGFLTQQDGEAHVFDLTTVIEKQVSETRDRYPAASLSVTMPDQAFVYGHRYLSEAIEELIENAIEHNDAPQPSVWITIDQTDTGTRLRVQDDGPGIPRMEKQTLVSGMETPVRHSQGIGLWLVKMTVMESGGSLDIGDRPPRGAEITVTLPSAPAPLESKEESNEIPMGIP